MSAHSKRLIRFIVLVRGKVLAVPGDLLKIV